MPQDPRIVDCENRSQDKSSLMSCFKGLEAAAPKLEPGKFGTVRPPINNPFWNVSTFVNSSTGDDNNTCTDSSHPCKTHAEIRARNGTPCPLRTAAVIETVMVDNPASDPFEICDAQGAGGSYEVLCNMTTTASGTLTGVVAKNRSTPQGLNANLGSAAAGSPGLLFTDTTRTAVSQVDSIVSGNVVFLSQPVQPTTPSSSIPAPPIDTVANGDSFTLQQQAKITITKVDPTLGDFVTNQAFLSHCLVQDPSGSGLSSTTMTDMTVGDSRIESALTAQTSVFENTYFGPHSNPIISDATTGAGGTEIASGTLTTAFLQSFASDFDLESDVIVRNVDVEREVGFPDFVYCPGTIKTRGLVEPSANSLIYGPCTVNAISPSLFIYAGSANTAATAFIGSTLQIDGVSVGAAWDRSKGTIAQIIPNIPLTQANLDAPVGPAGFGGRAFGSTMTGGFVQLAQLGAWPTVTPTVVDQGHGGTGLDAGCPPGQFLGGNPISCSAPSGAVTSVSAGAGISSSPTTGSVIVSNTGVLTLTPGSGIGLSGSTGNITVTNTAPGGGVSSLSATAPINVSASTGAVNISGSTPWSLAVGGTGANLAGACGSPGAVVANGTLGSLTCIAQLGSGQGGTGVSGPGLDGWQLIGHSGTWFNEPIPSNWTDVSTTSIGTSIVSAGGESVTAPLSGVLLIHLDLVFQGLGIDTNTYLADCGIGIDSTSLFTESTAVTVDDPQASGDARRQCSVNLRSAVAAGSHSSNALVQMRSSVSPGHVNVSGEIMTQWQPL